MNISSLSLKDKVAQLFTFPAFSEELDDITRKLITEWKIGGLFLGSNCLRSPEQVYALTSAAQQASITEGSGEPLFISADFVAGTGCKLKTGSVQFPKNRAIGAAGDEALAYESGRITALESLAMGVNFNYSPVMDINNNPLNPVIGTHSFGEDRDEVVRLGNAVIRGYQSNGLIATAKHFPGHGDTSVDSHEDLPVLPFDPERLRQFELIPFQRAIDEGVEAVMVGHMAVPSMDPSLTPASLSYELTTRLLREELGFDGIIVTDGLSMKGITNKYGMEDACVKALQAGADILLATTDSYEAAVSMFQAVLQAFESGVIPETRLDESLERIRRVKQKYSLTSERFTQRDYDHTAFMSEEGRKVTSRLAEMAVTPLSGIAPGDLVRRTLEPERLKLIAFDKCGVFTERLSEALPGLTTVIVKDAAEALEQLGTTGREGTVLLATAGSKPIGQELSTKLNRALSQCGEAVWIHFGSAYDVAETKHPGLLMYDFAPSLQDAAADYLLGRT